MDLQVRPAIMDLQVQQASNSSKFAQQVRTGSSCTLLPLIPTTICNPQQFATHQSALDLQNPAEPLEE
jgi:hypothetical protein